MVPIEHKLEQTGIELKNFCGKNNLCKYNYNTVKQLL
jgi:hypothetical protein